jgi:chromosome condensin MukBEF MukE localization factor
MPDESYAESVRAVIIRSGAEVATLDKIKEMVLVHRQKHNLLRPDDMEFTRSSKSDKKWEHRVRAALMELRRNGECALIGRAKYRFFL